MKQLKVSGNRAAARENIGHLLEYVTDITDADGLDPLVRTERKVIKFIADEYRSKGDRGAGMRMPVKYLEDGSYSWTRNTFIDASLIGVAF